jgi:DNA-binding NarL/FixJ family response regulator
VKAERCRGTAAIEFTELSRPLRVAVVGPWPGLPEADPSAPSGPVGSVGPVNMVRADQWDQDVEPARDRAARADPGAPPPGSSPDAQSGAAAQWVLAGPEADDTDIQRAVQRMTRNWADPMLAILGRSSDWRRCDRWTRRGCRVYLSDTADSRRVGAAIHAAHTLEITIVDQVFFRDRGSSGLGPAPHLTQRERDVLDLIRQGLRNREIGGVLHMSENTVEYHIRHLLEKFSARNRLEVVERATALGLV